MQEILRDIMTTKWETHHTTVLTNEEELAFLRIGSPNVKFRVFGFTVAWKI